MMEALRLGTIGSGSIVHTILNFVGQTEGIRLEAVYSRREDTGLALAQQYGASRVYTRLEDLLHDPDLDVIYIASPNLLHYEQTRQALLADKHVICEKPFCPRTEQVDELTALAEDRGLLLAEAVPTTFLPNYQVLKHSLSKLGRIRLVLANYSQRSYRYDSLLQGEMPNIFNPQLAGGCLMDINYYNLYLTVALFGRPEEVVYTPNLFRGIDTSGVVHLRYADFTAACAGAKDTWGVNAYQIEGEDGFLYVKDGSNGLAEIRLVTRDSDETINLQPFPDRRYYEVQALTELFRAGSAGELAPRLALSRLAVETAQRARASAGLRFPGDP